MKRSGSRTRATHSGAELSVRRSQLGTALSSPKPSFSSGLGSGSRTLIAFSSSVSSHGGHGGSVITQRRVSTHLTPSGSASSMYRSAAGEQTLISKRIRDTK
ncbi:hypothetical protein HPB50_006383 [Hyalomma asiaticum]|uniref:Uncharacterized protein n=1 Tax=Hyalomma asiaticum TaxID=266040 RepID=A0ACB7SVS0_HYAAI|nr:hypothetical protein HPB50_006383 [Hyalomma asiaticum]